ncbi:MAG: MFS transporter [Pseudomonadota bacterium]
MISRFAVATLMTTAFIMGTDFTGALLLVTPIESDFATDITTTQWVLNVYALAFGVFMVAGGRLGDLYGHKRMMLVGLCVFILGSAACYFSPSMAWLIGSRAVQGLGAAIMWPCILGYGATNASDANRALVMGMILAGITGGNVIGPLLSGVVTWLGDWRLFFLVNTLLAALMVPLVLSVLKSEQVAPSKERVDFVGISVLGLAILALLYALDVGVDWGWTSMGIIALLVLSALLFAAFPWTEGKMTHPLVPPDLLRDPQFLLILVTSGLLMAAVFSAFLYFPQFFQKTMGWSVLQASFGMIPIMALLSVGSAFAGRLYEPFGPRRLLIVGYIMIVIGALTVIFMDSAWGYFAVLPAMLLFGFGATLVVGPAGTAIVSAVPPERAGVASALSFMFHLVAGAVGVAGVTVIVNSYIAGAAAPDQAQAMASGISDAYWLPIVFATVGLLAACAIDEKRLRVASAAS